MQPYTRNMTEGLTYWPAVGFDAFGSAVYGPPEPRLGRWSDMAVLFRSAEGREETSTAVAHVNSPVSVAGKLLRGSSVSPFPLEGAREIRQVSRIPSLNGALELNKAFLG